jgi:uncharacterized cupredoxin-like copper-binding protein
MVGGLILRSTRNFASHLEENAMQPYSLYAVAALSLFSSLASGHGSPHSEPADYAVARETAFGRSADPRKAHRVVRIDMSDRMRFEPSELVLSRGETVRFVAVNNGKVMHEIVLGTRRDLEKHAEMMLRHPTMKHAEPNMVHVAPGKSGELGWQFTQAGEFYFGCLVPGHFEAGMIGKIIIRP